MGGGVLKFLSMVLKNVRRNPVRSALTIGSVSISLFLTSTLLAFFAINRDVSQTLEVYNRLVVMSSQGFAQPVPISLLSRVKEIDGVSAATPFSWYGGKYGEESIPFAQFGVDPESFFKVYDEFSVPEDQLKAFQQDKTACAVGRKLAADRGWKIGDRLPLTGDIYPFNLDLTIRAIYDASEKRNLRICYFHWDYLEEGLKRDFQGKQAGNAGVIMVKCRSSADMTRVGKAIDEMTRNSDRPTKTQSEEAFVTMFSDMLGDLKTLILLVGLAVGAALLCVSGVAMAMAIRERTTEIAVLKAIGFGRRLILRLVLSEAILVSFCGGIAGALGSKLFFDLIDVAPYTAGFLPLFYIPWPTALLGLGVSLFIGLASGLLPALRAANLSVVNGLRRVV